METPGEKNRRPSRGRMEPLEGRNRSPPKGKSCLVHRGRSDPFPGKEPGSSGGAGPRSGPSPWRGRNRPGKEPVSPPAPPGENRPLPGDEPNPPSGKESLSPVPGRKNRLSRFCSALGRSRLHRQNRCPPRGKNRPRSPCLWGGWPGLGPGGHKPPGSPVWGGGHVLGTPGLGGGTHPGAPRFGTGWGQTPGHPQFGMGVDKPSPVCDLGGSDP